MRALLLGLLLFSIIPVYAQQPELYDWLTSPSSNNNYSQAASIPVSIDLAVLNPASVTAELYKGDAIVWTYTGSPTGISIPTATLVSGTNYKLKIFNTARPWELDWSNDFFIISSTPILEVHLLNGNEIFRIGQPLIFSFRSNYYLGYGGVEVYKGATKVYGPSTAYNGMTSNIPTTGWAAGTDYKVKIVDLANPTRFDWSDAEFELTEYYVAGNALTTNTIVNAGVYDPARIEVLPQSSRVKTIEYQDDLGRMKQTILLNSAPGGENHVGVATYDVNGRQGTMYLPMAVGTTAKYVPGLLVTSPTNTQYAGSPHAAFYNNPVADPTFQIPDDAAPYAVTRFEPSPLGRVSETGAPGVAFQPNYSVPANGKTTKYSYGKNAANEVYRWTLTDNGNLTYTLSRSYYGQSLSVVTATDAEGVITKQYTDAGGAVVMVKSQLDATTWAETYNVYDNYGNVLFMLPPLCTKSITDQNLTSISSTNPIIQNLAYQYVYDTQDRKIAEKGPETDWTYLVYDRYSRVVLTQDPSQRPTNQWTFTKYDVISRPIMSGVTVISGTVESIRQTVESQTVTDEARGTTVHGYTNLAYPNVSDPEAYLNVTYYDDYCFKRTMSSDLTAYSTSSCVDIMNPPSIPTPKPFDYNPANAAFLPASDFKRIKGMVTGNKIKVLGTNQWIWTVSYYDQDQRMIQAISGNIKNGYDRLSNKIDFVGKLLTAQLEHFASLAGTAVRVTEDYEYDHAGRLVRKYHQIGTDPLKRIRLFELQYNALGDLINKKLHNPSAIVQSIDFRNNIRTWETKQSSENFSLEFAYNNTFSGITSSPTYNGSASAVRWTNNLLTTGANVDQEQSYSFAYDKFTRLTGMNYWERAENAPSWGSAQTKLTESGITYDLNGNLQHVLRKDKAGSSMDDLSYTYGTPTVPTNRLQSIADGGTANKGFKDGNTTATDYLYDAEGNLIKDLNNGINTITYNKLGLTEQITLTTGASIKNIYDAGGQKLAEEIRNTSGTLIKRTEFVGPFIYENNVIVHLTHDEGRALPIDATNWEYQYTISDHQGTSRVMLSATPRTFTYKATMETENSVTEEQDFLNIPGTRTLDVVANITPGGNEVARLSPSKPVGPSISLMVMPGDQVSPSVYVYHQGVGYGSVALSDPSMITAIAGAFGGVSGAPGDAGQIFNGVQSGFGAYGPTVNPSDNHPAAYINYILFDVDMVPITGGYARANANTSGVISIPTITVQKPGYMFIYVTNEGAASTPVAFDDLTIVHAESNVMGTYMTYPFGAEVEGYTFERQRMPDNKYRYQGKMLQRELGLELYEFAARMYDPLTGRWLSVDPAGQFPSPYVGMGNNPFNGVDPDGKLFIIDDIIVTVVGFVYGYVSHGITTGDWGGKAVAAGAISAVMFEVGYLTMGGGLAVFGGPMANTLVMQNAATFLINQGVNIAASSMFPSFPVIQTDRFTLSAVPTFSMQRAGLAIHGVYKASKKVTLTAGAGAGTTGYSFTGGISRTGRGFGYIYSYVGGGTKTAQRLAAITYKKGDFYFRFENDAFTSILQIGAHHDRWRTGGMELGYGKWSIGAQVETNDPAGAPGIMADKVNPCGLSNAYGLNRRGGPNSGLFRQGGFLGLGFGRGGGVMGSGAGRKKDNAFGAWRNGLVLNSPLYVGYRNGDQLIKAGYNGPGVQDIFQNGIHRFLMKQHYYNRYADYKGIYFQVANPNPFSFYDY